MSGDTEVKTQNAIRGIRKAIERDKQFREMADLLREAGRVFDLIGKFTGGDLTIVEQWREKYEALLSTLGKI